MTLGRLCQSASAPFIIGQKGKFISAHDHENAHFGILEKLHLDPQFILIIKLVVCFVVLFGSVIVLVVSVRKFSKILKNRKKLKLLDQKAMIKRKCRI